MADVRRFTTRRIESMMDPASPCPLRAVRTRELQIVLARVWRQARHETHILAALKRPDKGAIGAYLTTKQASGFELPPALLGVILRKEDGTPMDANSVGQAKHRALKKYPCPLPDPNSCEGNVAAGQPPCAHAIGRALFDDFTRRCLSVLTPDELRLFDPVLFLDAIKGL